MVIQKQRKAAKDKAERELRAHLKATVGHCELCGHDPERAHLRGGVSWSMEMHHIIRGMRPNELCAVLWVCWRCHSERLHGREKYTEARQLAVLLASRPDDFSLKLYNLLKNPKAPDRITESEVNQWR